MSNGTASHTQFSQVVNFFTTAIATIINEFSIVDLINCLSKKGEKLTQFLRLVLQALMEGKEIVIDLSRKLIQIDRSKVFDPKKFIGEGWETIEQDERALKITELDLNEVQFEDSLKEGETSIKGEQRLKRAKEDGRIRLDAAVFLSLWNNKHLIPESWKEKINGNTRFIYFDGTILRDPHGDRDVLYLYWGVGGWGWGYDWLGNGFDVDDVSALLESKNN